MESGALFDANDTGPGSCPFLFLRCLEMPFHIGVMMNINAGKKCSLQKYQSTRKFALQNVRAFAFVEPCSAKQ